MTSPRCHLIGHLDIVVVKFCIRHHVLHFLPDRHKLNPIIGWKSARINVSVTNALPGWCEFKAVLCDSDDSSPSYASVISIGSQQFSGATADGTLPSSIGNLGNLRRLNLNGMRLASTIPITIGDLTNLVSLQLADNKLAGIVPSTIGSMRLLRQIFLNGNLLTGTLPSTIGFLTNLGVLILGSNKIRGTLPSTIGFMRSLQFMYLGSNSLTGTIPSTIGSLTNLGILNIGKNKVGGTLPVTIGLMKSLQLIDLSNNILTGTIPATFKNLIRLSSLTFETNYLTMGTATTVPTSTFSSAALNYLASGSGSYALSGNCLAFSYGTTSVTSTHCLPSSSELFIYFHPCLVLRYTGIQMFDLPTRLG